MAITIISLMNESYEIIYQVEFKNSWLIYTTMIAKTNSEYKLYKLNSNEMEQSLLETNRFSLQIKEFLVIQYYLQV